MPFPRPTSPVSLEVCSPSADDIVSDDVLGSDDELGEDARNAQRQRIEKLAEAYLQGAPLFILSASLKGPFDQGWVNPWTKKRKSHSAAEDSSDPVVQETDPRPRKQLHHEPHGLSRRTETSVAPSDTPSESSVASSKHRKSCRPLQDKRSRNPAPVQGTPKRTVSWTGDAQLNSKLHNSSIASPTDDNWLKRDRRRIGFRNFDPPTSPTTTVSSRLSDLRSRRHQSIVPSPRQSSAKKIVTEEPISPQVDRLQRSRCSESVAESHFRPSPIRQQNVPHSATHPAQSDTSFCIVSSSSQLPKFEFRRRRKRSKSLTTKQAEEEPYPPSETDRNAQQAHERQFTPSKESLKESAKPENVYNDPSRRTFTSTAGSRAFDSHTASRLSQGLLESRTTHGTIENLPSAQPVPLNPAMADYAPSLHYTAPATSAEEEEDDDVTGPVPPLSTQAALLHAQKSFQDALESQMEDQPTTSSEKRRSSRSSLPSSTTSQKITPFHRLNTPHLAPDNSPSRIAAAVMPSTQCIVDAVTPFTFSTEKKRHRHAHIESLPRITSSNKKQKTSIFLDRSPSRDSDWPPSSERDQSDHRIQSAGESPRDSQTGVNPNENNHGPSQSTALPLTLSGTTPPTGQDGQGGLAGESFNLSQAIADAGSWLQESFDLNRDLRRSGNIPSVSSRDAQRSALNLDTH